MDGARGPRLCDDFLDRNFLIGQGRAARDCIWLQDQPVTIQKLYCVPGSDAYDVCEETCGKCVDQCSDETNAAFLIFMEDAYGDSSVPEIRGCSWLRDFPRIVPSSVWRVTMPTFYAPRRATRVLPKKFFGSVIRVILTQRKREIEIGFRTEQGKITGRPTIGLEFIEEQLNACHANHGKDMKLQSHPIA